LCGREGVGVGELGWSEFVPTNQAPLDVIGGITEEARQGRIAVGDIPVDIADVDADRCVFTFPLGGVDILRLVAHRDH
jgi:hypothetical protein